MDDDLYAINHAEGQLSNVTEREQGEGDAPPSSLANGDLSLNHQYFIRDHLGNENR